MVGGGRPCCVLGGRESATDVIERGITHDGRRWEGGALPYLAAIKSWECTWNQNPPKVNVPFPQLSMYTRNYLRGGVMAVKSIKMKDCLSNEPVWGGGGGSAALLCN